MTDIGTLIDFTDGNVLYAAQLDSNFSDIRTVVNNTVVHTNKASQTITKTVTFTPDAGVAFTVSTGGATITAGGLTITAGGETITAGDLTVTAGNVALTAGNLTFGAASARIIPGATSLLFRNNANNADNLSITDAGAVATRAGFTSGGQLVVSASGASVTGDSTFAGNLNVTSAGVVGFAGTSISHSNATGVFIVGATTWALKDSGQGVNVLSTSGTGVNTIVAMNSGSSGTLTLQGPTTNAKIQFSGNNVTASSTAGNVVLGGGAGIATGATANIPSCPTMAGIPTGGGGLVVGSFVVDDTNNRAYFKTTAGWKYAALT